MYTKKEKRKCYLSDIDETKFVFLNVSLMLLSGSANLIVMSRRILNVIVNYFH